MFAFQLLPSLALYLHLVGNVGRDVQRTVEGRILKVSSMIYEKVRMFFFLYGKEF